MSWYVDFNGRQVWIDNDDRAYTVSPPEDDLPLRTLTYCLQSSQKKVYAEYSIDEEPGKKSKMAGRQRGYIVRVDQDEKTRVISCFQAAADRLIDTGVVSRIDVDETGLEKKKKKRSGRKAQSVDAPEENGIEGEEEKEAPLPSIDLQSLADNECRVETASRCQHQAHGLGFRLQVAFENELQSVHCFTAQRELPGSEWHKHIVEALERTGSRVMLARMRRDDPGGPPQSAAADDGRAGPKGSKSVGPKDKAQIEENDWLDSLIGRSCIASKKAEEDDASEPTSPTSPTDAAPSKAPAALPPWLRTHSKKAR